MITGWFDLKQSGCKGAGPLKLALVTRLSVMRTKGRNQEQVIDSRKVTMTCRCRKNVTVKI